MNETDENFTAISEDEIKTVIVKYKNMQAMSNSLRTFKLGLIKSLTIAPYSFMNLTLREMNQLAKSKYVERVELDTPQHTMEVPITEKTLVGEPTLADSKAYINGNTGYTGNGVTVAVLDTGIQSTHPMLINQVIAKYQISSGDIEDGSGHGCIEPDARIRTTLGGIETIKEFYDRTEQKWGSKKSELGSTVIPKNSIYTLGYNHKDNKEDKSQILGVHKIPYKGKVVKVTSGSSSFITTPWHPFLIYDRRRNIVREISADSLKTANMRLLRPKRGLQLGIISVDLNLAYLAGRVVGDGHLTKGKPNKYVLLSGVDEKFLKEFGYNYYKRNKRDFEIYKLYHKLIKFGIPPGNKSRTIRLPEIVGKSNNKTIYAFLAGLIDADGSFDKARPRLRVISGSKGFARDLVCLFMSLGYDSRMSEQIDNRKNRKIIAKGPYYCISISGPDFLNFYEKIKPFLRTKKIRNSRRYKRHQTKPIKKIEFIDFNGYLYDLTTSTSNYLAGKEYMTYIHNTWCASCVAGNPITSPYVMEGMAPNAKLINIKVFTDGGGGTSSGFMEGVNKAVELGADVISYSGGGTDSIPYSSSVFFY